MDTFGVIVICTKRDYLFAKGCCASVRYFMGDVPLCLLVDGVFDYSDLVKTYNAKVISTDTIKTPGLRERSFGWGTTRLIAFWESPFEHFLIVDSDTIVWGDMTVYAEKLNSYHMILDRPCYSYSEETIKHWFFDTDKIKKLFPNFQALVHPYVCPGILFSRKHIFDLHEYMQILDLAERDPNLFFPGDMGFINLMIYKLKEEGKMEVDNEDIQYLVCDFKAKDMRETFPIQEKPIITKKPTILHFTGGIKPIVSSNPERYTEPAIFFRKQYLKDRAGITGLLADAIIKFEDIQWRYRTQLPYYKKRIAEMIGGK